MTITIDNDHEAIKSAVHSWFFEYVETFIQCAKSPERGADDLRKYFHVPVSMVTSTMFVALSTPESIGAFLGHEMSQLAKADYGGSEALDPEIVIFNQKAATITVTWSRRNLRGVEFQRVRVSYWVANTELGWRIVSGAVHDAKTLA